MEVANKPLSLEQYATSILEDERVIDTLKKINASNRMHQHFLTLPLEKVSAEELAYAGRYRDALKRAKEKAFKEIIRKSMPDRWLYVNDLSAIAHNTIVGEPSYDDLPIIMLWHMSVDVSFRPYLLDGVLPWFGTLPDEKTQQFVFALFLWVKMNARYDSVRGRSFYVKAEAELPFNAPITMTLDERRQISTVADRLSFIGLFRGYIHTDMWTAEDYDKQGKQGLVMRLRMTSPLTGNIVIQECGEKTAKCNKLYAASALNIETIRSAYLDQGRLLRVSQSTAPPELTFQCKHCASDKASIFLHVNRRIHFYCDIKCFNGSLL